jgi:hypothetical protein
MKNSFLTNLKIEFDNETMQWILYNDMTPWIYWAWETKNEALEEYMSSFKDFILVNYNIKNESKTFA